jgi:poly [ADP-ribose] polymerase
MFGDGVYFSDQSTKSLNYCTGFWGGGASQRAFMILSDVAMGKIYEPTRSFRGSVSAHGDSVFAKPGKAGIMNNEMVVARTSQIMSKVLCEFS